MLYTNIINATRFLKQPLCALLLPRRCQLCRNHSQAGINICTECSQILPILTQVCRQCARPSHQGNDIAQCGVCLKNNPPFNATYCLFSYQSPIKQWLLALKFYAHLHHTELFSQLFLQRIHQEWYINRPYPDLIIPMPLHTKRLRERGFNQAVEIARPLAQALSIPLDLKGVIRLKATQPQMALSADLRAKNVANAFQVKRHYADLSIAILDDVVTTGHTVTALASTLKANGAKEIHIWSIAKAMLS